MSIDEIIFSCFLILGVILWLYVLVYRRYLFTERRALLEADLLPLPPDWGDNVYLAEIKTLAEPVIAFRYRPAETDVCYAFRNDQSLQITCSTNDKPHLKVEYEQMYYRHLFFGKRDYVTGPTRYYYKFVVPEIKSVSADKYYFFATESHF